MPATNVSLRRLAGLAATLILLSLPRSAALASSARDNISVSIDVVESCKISASPSGIRSSVPKVSLELTLACSKGVSASVILSHSVVGDVDHLPVKLASPNTSVMGAAGLFSHHQLSSAENHVKAFGSEQPTSQHFRASDSSDMTFEIYSQRASGKERSSDGHAETIVATVVF